MAEPRLRILQVSTVDNHGGSARIAWGLHHAYRERGLDAWMAVAHKFSDDSNVLLVPKDNSRNRWWSTLFSIGNMLYPLVKKLPGARILRNQLHSVRHTGRVLEALRGYESFDFPGTWKLLDLPAKTPDIIHCHNLHGGYFDLRVLPWLSHQVPVILMLHDAWLLSGHCAHSFECERWLTGCGQCPYLNTYPAVRHDATAHNWKQKQDIYARCRLYVTTPSQWLMQKVEHSMLAPAIVDSRVIRNGVDMSVFHPVDKQAIRASLKIPQDAKVLLFSAKNIRGSIWKDSHTLCIAVSLIAEHLQKQKVFFIALGKSSPIKQIGKARVCFVPYQDDPKILASYYQAADVYVYTAKADTFPTTVLEALACGTPVVATAIGGIPEQIDDGVNGFLVQPGDPEKVAACVEQILQNDELSKRMRTKSVESARRYFNLEQQTDDFLNWYNEILQQWPGGTSGSV